MKTRITLFFVLVLLIAAAGTGIQQGPGGKKVKVKPDIVISDLSIVPPSSAPGEVHHIRIKVTVTNPNGGSATGPFKILCELWDPIGGSKALGEASVTDLVNSPDLATAPVKTVYFDQSVRRGNTVPYRIKVDHTNIVAETDETNNIRSIIYTAR